MNTNPGSSVLINLAENGFFYDRRLLPQNDFSVGLLKKEYIIRQARMSDLESLINLEKICWNEISVPDAELLRRLTVHPTGQWVAVLDGVVVGANRKSVV